ncbi:MAG: thioredoxin-dependent peroxiredoxin [Acidimicrobiaceae bacterium]|nr:thioredoxin-dependent peroxiredoxin [Acidimicrobiaceae bacterium]
MLSDVDRSVGETYGAKKQPGEKFPDFPSRLTFLIDPEGTVKKVYQVTDVATHPDEVLKEILSLSGAGGP